MGREELRRFAGSCGRRKASGFFSPTPTRITCLGSTRRALNDAVEHNAVLVSYSPEQELGLVLGARADPGRILAAWRCVIRLRESIIRHFPDAAANGQFLMILRETYEKVGGHHAIADQVLEDVALARQSEGGGIFGIYFTAPMGTVQTRMYRNFAAMWQGWTKNLYPLMGGSPRSGWRGAARSSPTSRDSWAWRCYGWLLVRAHRAPVWS